MAHRSVILCLIVGFAAISCGDPEPAFVVPNEQSEWSHPDWIRVEIPGGREAYSVVGDINRALMVTTYTKAFVSHDRGKTWTESVDFNGPTWLFQRSDTIWALTMQLTEANCNRLATGNSRFTLDFGKTWAFNHSGNSSLSVPIGRVESVSGISYRLTEQRVPVAPGSPSCFIGQSTLERAENGTRTIDLFQGFRLLNLYLDETEHLYVGSSSGSFNEDKLYQGTEAGMPAYLFISKNKLP